MYYSCLRLLLLVVIVAGARSVSAQDLPPIQSDLFEGPEHPYEEHPFDQQHIRVDVRIDPVERTVSGSASLHVRPLEPLRQIRLMAADMVVDSVLVESGGRTFVADFEQSGSDSLVVTLVPTGDDGEATDSLDGVSEPAADSTLDASGATPTVAGESLSTAMDTALAAGDPMLSAPGDSGIAAVNDSLRRPADPTLAPGEPATTQDSASASEDPAAGDGAPTSVEPGIALADTTTGSAGGEATDSAFSPSGEAEAIPPDVPEPPARDDPFEGTAAVPADSSDLQAESAVSEPFVVTAYYRARPSVGLYFVPPYETEEAELVQVWSQGESELNRHWFPVYDHPGDKLTSEVSVTIDSAYFVVSNGHLEEERLNADGTRTFHYVQTQPHAPYLISIAADDYASVRSHAMLPNGQRIPLTYHALPERLDDVERTLGQTPEIMAFFSELLGMPFPWSKYDQTFVRDFMWGGMENTGATTLTDRMLIDERAARDYRPENLVAHELAHQWFGDLVTARHWSDIWIHEGFASHLEALYTERTRGREAYLLEMQANFDAYLRESRDYVRPIVWNRWVAPMDVFDRHAFDKGSWVLHMLRENVGEEVFSAVLEQFLEEHAYGSVTSEDFQSAIEDVTGESFDGFFDQWVYAAGHPVLDVRHTYDAENARLRVVVRQTQEAELVPPAFRFPLELEIQTLSGAERHEVAISEREHDYTFELNMPPRYVLPDPDRQVLAEIHVDQPAAAWVAQLRHALEPVSRLLAARALAAFVEQPALLVGLSSALDVEQSPAVRREIIRTVALLPNDQAKERVLLASTRDDRSEVREAAVEALGSFAESEAARTRALELAHGEASYKAQAAAVRALARMGAPEAEGVVRSALVTPSFREYIRRAAFQALPHLALPAREAFDIATHYSDPGQPTEARTGAVAYLGVLAETQERALFRLIDLLGDDTYRVRDAAAQALAKVAHPRASEALRARLDVEPEPRIRQRLRKSIQHWELSFAGQRGG